MSSNRNDVNLCTALSISLTDYIVTFITAIGSHTVHAASKARKPEIVTQNFLSHSHGKLADNIFPLAEHGGNVQVSIREKQELNTCYL